MEQVREITECCICMDTYTDPKILSCIHTFCLKCLEETAVRRDSKPGDDIPCPICRKPFVIPKEGMADLPNNIFMMRLVEITKLSALPSNAILCETCKPDVDENTKEVPLTVQYCIQCHQNICDRCCQDHKRFKDLQNHKLIEIGSPLKDELIRKASFQYCRLHGKEKAKLYCIDCEEIICMMCFAKAHKTHDCVDTEEIADKIRRQISRDLEIMSGFAEEATAKLQQIDEMQKNFLRQIDKIEKDIIQRGSEVKKRVDIYTRSLLDELALIKQRVSKENKGRRVESETHKMIVQTFETYYMALRTNGTDAELCRAANNVHLRAEELQKEHRKHIMQKIYSTDVELESSTSVESLVIEDVIGNLRESASSLLPQSDADGNEVKFHSSNVDFLSADNIMKCIHESFVFDQVKDDDDESNKDVSIRFAGEVWGKIFSFPSAVTKLGNKIYVLFNKVIHTNSVRVFDDHEPFSLQTEILMKEVKDPIRLVSSDISKCLYISDKSNECIWKMTIENHRLAKGLDGIDSGPYTLSVTREDHLLLLRWGGLLHDRIEIYGSDAKLIRYLLLPSDVLQPRGVVQNSNGEFIVSHRLNNTKNGPWVFSAVAKDGLEVICQSDPNDTSQGLKEPTHFALDSEKNRIFVADEKLNQLTLFGSHSLRFINILQKKEFYGAAHLSYAENTMELFVCSGYVHVYKVY